MTAQYGAAAHVAVERMWPTEAGTCAADNFGKTNSPRSQNDGEGRLEMGFQIWDTARRWEPIVSAESKRSEIRPRRQNG
jgi:hypothetical protein